MADYHEFDDFDGILKSIDPAADGAANDVNLDELLAQLSVEFPADFGDKAPSKPAEDAPAEAPKKAKKARKEPKTPRAAKQQEEARSSQQEEAPSPQQEPQDSPDLPQKTGGFLDTVSRHHKGINLALAIIALVLVAGIVAVVLWQTNADPYQNKIVSNVRVAGVDVGGMTRQEAAEAVSTAVGSSYTSTDMTVVLGKEELILAASQTRPKLNIAQASELAYAYAAAPYPISCPAFRLNMSPPATRWRVPAPAWMRTVMTPPFPARTWYSPSVPPAVTMIWPVS